MATIHNNPAGIERLSLVERAIDRFSSLKGYVLGAVIVIGPLLALLTVIELKRHDGVISSVSQSTMAQFVLGADILYTVFVLGFLIARFAVSRMARRAGAASSRLHSRFTVAFVVSAAMPAALIAVFALVTISFGINAWHSERVATVIQQSQALTERWREAQAEQAKVAAEAIASSIAGATRQGLSTTTALREASEILDVSQAFVIDRSRRVRWRGRTDYRGNHATFLFDYIPPSEARMRDAERGVSTSIFDSKTGEFRALAPLPGSAGLYLYVIHRVDRESRFQASTIEAVTTEFQQVSQLGDRILFNIGLIYVLFLIFTLLSSLLLGFTLANRFHAPIAQLAAATRRIGRGDLETRVEVPSTRDVLAELSETFNQMAQQVQNQRHSLLEARQVEKLRRVFTERVLAGVPAGVIGTNRDWQIEVANRAAGEILGRELRGYEGIGVLDAFPEIENEMSQAEAAPSKFSVGEIERMGPGGKRLVLVAIAPMLLDGQLRGYVITFEDLTERVAAERQAAWGEVARKMAHEIKNPLTPVLLAANRLRSKVSTDSEESRDLLVAYTEIIETQVGQINRLVEAFTQLGRFPAPQIKLESVSEMLEGCMLLQRAAEPGIEHVLEVEPAILCKCDVGLFSQAVLNIVQNAATAIHLRAEAAAATDCAEVAGRIVVRAREQVGQLVLEFEDNGTGLPQGIDYTSLLEPYRVGTERGTGLGLAIARETVIRHGGSIQLLDAPIPPGAMVRIVLPSASRGERG